jgi:MoxR-like ATPase
MQEHTVTTAGQTFRLEPPFFVLATQNPIEQEGTYPLPEAQLDRFLFKVQVPLVNRDELNEIVSRTILRQPVEVKQLLDGPRILKLRKLLDKVVTADPVRDYAVRLVLATHPGSGMESPGVGRYVRWGASPRAAQGLIKAGRVRALTEGRPHLAFEDIRYYAEEVLQHRLLLNYDGQAEGMQTSALIRELIDYVPEQV